MDVSAAQPSQATENGNASTCLRRRQAMDFMNTIPPQYPHGKEEDEPRQMSVEYSAHSSLPSDSGRKSFRRLPGPIGRTS
jgi:hypothetical protein